MSSPDILSFLSKFVSIHQHSLPPTNYPSVKTSLFALNPFPSEKKPQAIEEWESRERNTTIPRQTQENAMFRFFFLVNEH